MKQMAPCREIMPLFRNKLRVFSLILKRASHHSVVGFPRVTTISIATWTHHSKTNTWVKRWTPRYVPEGSS